MDIHDQLRTIMEHFEIAFPFESSTVSAADHDEQQHSGMSNSGKTSKHEVVEKDDAEEKRNERTRMQWVFPSFLKCIEEDHSEQSLEEIRMQWSTQINAVPLNEATPAPLNALWKTANNSSLKCINSTPRFPMVSSIDSSIAFVAN